MSVYKIPHLCLNSCLYGVSSQSNKNEVICWLYIIYCCVCRCYHLFQQTPSSNVIILGQVFGCLLTKGVNKSVTSIVMEMAYTFLGDNQGPGISLVLPHSKVIMQYLNIALQGSVKGCSLEMAVLSRSVYVSMLKRSHYFYFNHARMSQYVSDSHNATQLVCLLVPFIQQSVLKSQV